MNQRVVVWSVVGVVAVILCVGWVIMSRPATAPRRDRASVSRGQEAETGKEDAEERRNVTSPPRPTEDSTRETPNPTARQPDVPVAPELPKETARPAVESPASEPPTSQPTPPAHATDPPSPAVVARQILFQAVEIRRSPTFSFHGLETKQSLHYQVLSQLNVESNVESRTTNVVQLVEDTKLVAADDPSRESFAKALENLKRQQYTYRLNDRGEVTEFTGHKETRTTIPLDLASAAGFQLTSVIDEDGWKELAELTFVMPPDDQREGEPWKRQMTHDWGALGGWSGITTFTPQPLRRQLQPIAFIREMNYTPPGAAAGGLPFQIRDAAFELQQAAGTIEFDVTAQRVRNAAEDFEVRGRVTAELAGVAVQIDLAEQQRIEIRLSEQRLTLQ